LYTTSKKGTGVVRVGVTGKKNFSEVQDTQSPVKLMIPKNGCRVGGGRGRAKPKIPKVEKKKKNHG